MEDQSSPSTMNDATYAESSYVNPEAMLRRPLIGNPYIRVFLFLVGYLLVALFISTIGLFVLTAMGKLDPMAFAGRTTEELIEVLHGYLLPIVVASGIYSILYTWAFRRVVDRRSFVSLGLAMRRPWGSEFAKGMVLATLILGIIFGISLLSGSVRIAGFVRPAPETTSILAYLLGALVAFVLVGIYEEVMFRGYVLQNLESGAGRLVAVLISSLLFALLHGLNPGAGFLSTINTLIIGAFLCVLYFRTGSLWMPIGFHFAWDFLLGYVVSLPVSGLPMYGLLKVEEVEAGSRVAGGLYGPEAGAACTLALVIWGAWFLISRSRRRGVHDNPRRQEP